MARRKEPSIPDALLDQLLSGADPKTAFDPGGLLDGEIFYSLAEARVVIESWRRHYNTARPHSSLGYRPPAPQVLQWPASPSGPASPATPALAQRPLMN